MGEEVGCGVEGIQWETFRHRAEGGVTHGQQPGSGCWGLWGARLEPCRVEGGGGAVLSTRFWDWTAVGSDGGNSLLVTHRELTSEQVP